MAKQGEAENRGKHRETQENGGKHWKTQGNMVKHNKIAGFQCNAIQNRSKSKSKSLNR